MLYSHAAEGCPHLAIQVRDAVHRVPPLILFLFLRLLHLLLFLPNQQQAFKLQIYLRYCVLCVYDAVRRLTFL